MFEIMTWPTLSNDVVSNDSLTTLGERSVFLNNDDPLVLRRLGAAVQDARPVDFVVVAEFFVSLDVDAAVVYVLQRS